METATIAVKVVKMNRQEIQEFILNDFKRRGISKRHYADIAGCTAEAVGHWEHGKRLITYEQAEKIAKELGFEFKVEIK